MQIKTLIALSLLWLSGLASIAADATFNSVTLNWSPNTEEDLAGYRLYFSKNPEVWTHVKAVELTTATVELPSPGTWYFIVTAKNTAGLESLPSNVVSYTTPTGPSPPGGFKIVSSVSTQVSTVTMSANPVIVP